MFLNRCSSRCSPASTAKGRSAAAARPKVWRSFLTDEYAKSFAKTGGIGIATDVYSELLRHQGIDVKASTGGGTVGKGLHGKGAYAQ